MTEILEQLEINQTFFYQFILFGAFFFILSGLCLRPFQRLLAKRNHRLNDDLQSASELLRTVEARIQEYERSLSQSRAEALKNYEKTLSEVRSSEDARIATIRDEIKKDFLKASVQLQDEKLKIESELKLQINQISDSVVQKMMVGKV